MYACVAGFRTDEIQPVWDALIHTPCDSLLHEAITLHSSNQIIYIDRPFIVKI